MGMVLAFLHISSPPTKNLRNFIMYSFIPHFALIQSDDDDVVSSRYASAKVLLVKGTQFQSHHFITNIEITNPTFLIQSDRRITAP